ncbi:MAG: DUF2061 domain-containing protein [Gemmatimonadota bacterium]|nr:DUF2061 domain-containing protein [Gemmatimonadota bacterium]
MTAPYRPESRPRSLAKALSWRVLATMVTVALVFAFTGRLDIAVALGGVEVLAKLAVYYLHERVWQRVSWGTRDVDGD